MHRRSTAVIESQNSISRSAISSNEHATPPVHVRRRSSARSSASVMPDRSTPRGGMRERQRSLLLPAYVRTYVKAKAAARTSMLPKGSRWSARPATAALLGRSSRAHPGASSARFCPELFNPPLIFCLLLRTLAYQPLRDKNHQDRDYEVHHGMKASSACAKNAPHIASTPPAALTADTIKHDELRTTGSYGWALGAFEDRPSEFSRLRTKRCRPKGRARQL